MVSTVAEYYSGLLHRNIRKAYATAHAGRPRTFRRHSVISPDQPGLSLLRSVNYCTDTLCQLYR